MTTTGIWLIGIGSVLVFGGLVFGSDEAGIGIRFGRFDRRVERLRFAVECVGAGFAAVGSVVVAVENPPPLWVLIALVPAYLLAHFLTAWKLRQYWLKRVEHEPRGQAADERSRRPYNACLERCPSWRWCLRHPLNVETWPKAIMRTHGAPDWPET
jgi:hypothetical protein